MKLDSIYDDFEESDLFIDTTGLNPYFFVGDYYIEARWKEFSDNQYLQILVNGAELDDFENDELESILEILKREYKEVRRIVCEREKKIFKRLGNETRNFLIYIVGYILENIAFNFITPNQYK